MVRFDSDLKPYVRLSNQVVEPYLMGILIQKMQMNLADVVFSKPNGMTTILYLALFALMAHFKGGKRVKNQGVYQIRK